MPQAGPALPVTTADSADAVNEPCYDIAKDKTYCPRYAVCCVKVGTCTTTHGGWVSSNAKYYTGGCWSASSSKGSVPSGCAKQGECHAGYLYHMKNGTSGAGVMDPIPAASATALMTGATGDCNGGVVPGSDAYGSTGVSRAGLSTAVLIIIIVVAVLVVVGGGAGAFMMMKKGAPTKQAGAPDNAVQAGAPDNAVTEA